MQLQNNLAPEDEQFIGFSNYYLNIKDTQTAGTRLLKERDISPGDGVDLLSDNCQISPFIAQVYRSLENLYNEGYLNGVPFRNN